MSDEELTLENIRSKKTFVKIHKNKNKTVYIDGLRARRFTVPGKWKKMPLFPDLDEMSTKTRWVSDNNPKHYFVKNSTTNNWDERDDDKWTYGYRFVSYEGRNVILFSDKLKRFIEIGDNEVKITFAPIESLDDIENIIFSFAGKWKTSTKAPTEMICGIPSITPWKLKNRIIGGDEAKRNSWPWAVLLDIIGDQFIHKCGASLISNRWILTAAHCFIFFKPKEVQAYLGIHDLSERKNARITVKYDDIIQNSAFNESSKMNDIALIKLPERVQFNEKIWPICLPNKNLVKIGSNSIAVGWGITEEQDMSSVLKQVIIPILQFEDCNLLSINETEQKICAGEKESINIDDIKDTCQGDSGGPQVVINQQNPTQFVQIGLVSHGKSAYCKGEGVYTNVAAYKDWIIQTVKKFGDKNDKLYFV